MMKLINHVAAMALSPTKLQIQKLSSIATKLIGSSGATGTSAQLPSCSTLPGCNSGGRETSCASRRRMMRVRFLCMTMINNTPNSSVAVVVAVFW